eukprot:jgi/Hompol1/4704/HPOL_003826-RA
MADDLRRAVELAYSSPDPNVKRQATEYIEQLKNSPRGWELCLTALADPQPTRPEFLFFYMQVIDSMLLGRYNSLAPNERIFVQQTIWSLFQPFALDGSKPPFLLNRLCVTIVQLFKLQYPNEWPTFFDQLFEALSMSNAQRAMIVAFLRICKTIDEEVVCQYVSRTAEDVARNTIIKDYMRESAVARLVDAWLAILQSGTSADPDITNTCLGLFGAYVSWIDINLVLRPEFVTALLSFLAIEDLQIAACDCLAEIVAKGMKPTDKLQLLSLLKLPTILSTVQTSSERLDEQLAKLINTIGLELCSCHRDTENVYDRVQALQGLDATFPFLERFLSNEFDDTVSILFPFVSSLLLLLKRIKKEGMSQLQSDNLARLLHVLIGKMKYLDDEEYKLGGDTDDEDDLFFQLRKSIKAFLESIASIDDTLFVSTVSNLVCHNLERLQRGVLAGKPLQTVLKWPDAELSLYLLHIFIEAKPFKDISSYPHDSIPIIFFEAVVRYSHFFEQRPEYLPSALQAFVDSRGLHHPSLFVRIRLNYLFLRFIKSLRQIIGQYSHSLLDSIKDLLSIAPRSSVEVTSNGGSATSIPNIQTATSDSAAEVDSQQFLFEAVGFLISLDTVDEAKRSGLLRSALSPMVFLIETQLQRQLSPEDLDPSSILLLADAITAIGSIGKGFPDYIGSETLSSPPTSSTTAHSTRLSMDVQAAQIFQEALHRILLVLQQFSADHRIRNAARFALQRLVGCVGPAVFDHLPTFLSAGLLSSSTATELIDFLPFIGLMIHKFKSSIVGILTSLWGPLREKIFLFLNQPAAGTDDFIQQLSLRRAYLTLLVALFNADMPEVLTSPSNIQHLNTTLLSILLCLDDNSDASVHKLVFSLFAKMTYCWAGDDTLHGQTATSVSTVKGGADATALKKALTNGTTVAQARDPGLKRMPLAGFNQFVFESIVPAMFELPLRPSFNPLDGQAAVLLTELANLHKTAFEVFGLEYIEVLSKAYLPSRGCPEAVTQTFCANIVNLDKKALKKYLREFVQLVRQ